VAAQVVAVVVTFFFQMRLIRREIDFDGDVVRQLVAGAAAAGIVAATFSLLASRIDSIWALLAALAGCALTGWAAIALLVPTAIQRKAIGQLVEKKLPARYHRG
jgi:hypothetical protein